LLGPNGAGKTTSFYIIMGLIAADYGTISLDGLAALHRNTDVAQNRASFEAFTDGRGRQPLIFGDKARAIDRRLGRVNQSFGAFGLLTHSASFHSTNKKNSTVSTGSHHARDLIIPDRR